MSASGPGADMREAPINFCFRGYNRHANFRTSFQPLTDSVEKRLVIFGEQ
jgi:hypothetical protein